MRPFVYAGLAVAVVCLIDQAAAPGYLQSGTVAKLRSRAAKEQVEQKAKAAAKPKCRPATTDLDKMLLYMGETCLK